MKELLSSTYLNNTIQNYLFSIAIIIAGLLLIRIFKSLLLKKIIGWSGKTTTHLEDFIVSSIERFGIPALYIATVYAGITFLTLSPRLHSILNVAITFAITFLVIQLISSIILVLLRSYILRQEHGTEKVKQLGGIMLLINVIIWGIGILFFFDNIGYDITAIIAGLGIGGIAIALASLGNKVCCIDADIGLRNLDIVLGLENRIVYDLVDVVEGRAKLSQAMI